MIKLLDGEPGTQYGSKEFWSDEPGPVCLVETLDTKRDFMFAIHFRRWTDQHWKPDGIPWQI
jgi:hypothetical protein